jgi:hypothetical protein
LYAPTLAAALAGCGSTDSFDDLFAPSAALDAGPRSDARPSNDAGRIDAIEAGDRAPNDTSPSAEDVAPEVHRVDAPASDVAGEPAVADATSDAIADASDPGGPLHQQRWEEPCAETLPYDPSLCASLPNGDCHDDYRPVDKIVTFGGVQEMRYSVTLRVRGVVELKSYDGGEATGGHFRIGGTPAAGTVNVYGLTVSSPAQTYYINDDAAGSGAVVAVVDDTVTIDIDGGAKIELFASDSDCVELRNCVSPDTPVCTPYVIPGIPPAPNAFAGQFAQVDVVSTVPRPFP